MAYRYIKYNKTTGEFSVGITGGPEYASRHETETVGVMPCPDGVSDATHKIVFDESGVPQLQTR